LDNDIGKLIKEKRKEKKLTLEQVAKRVGVGKSTVSKWERGAIKNMKRDKLDALSQLLGIDPLTLILGFNSNFEIETISPAQFKKEVSELLYRCPDLSEQERQIFSSILSTIEET